MSGISIDDLLDLTRNDTAGTRGTRIGVPDSSGDIEKQQQSLPRPNEESIAGENAS